MKSVLELVPIWCQDVIRFFYHIYHLHRVFWSWLRILEQMQLKTEAFDCKWVMLTVWFHQNHSFFKRLRFGTVLPSLIQKSSSTIKFKNNFRMLRVEKVPRRHYWWYDQVENFDLYVKKFWSFLLQEWIIVRATCIVYNIVRAISRGFKYLIPVAKINSILG